MSDQNVRITQPSLSSISFGSHTSSKKSGNLDGVTLSLRGIEDDVDDQFEINHRRQSFGLDLPRPEFSLRQMKLETRDKLPEFNSGAIRQYLKSLSNTKSSAELTQSLMRQLVNGTPILLIGKSQKEITEYAVALHRLDAALHGSDVEFIEWLSPLRPEAPNLAELAKKLQETKGDGKQMLSLLSEFKGLPDDDQKIAKQFGTACFDINQLKSELSKAQQLPWPSEDLKKQIAEKVKDEIKEVHRQHGSHLLALRNLLEKAGDLTSLDLADSYDQLVHGNGNGITSTMEILVTRHSPKDLLDTVIPIIEKTLSHELSLGDDQRSVEKEKLHAILSEIQQMNILKALVERLGNFVASLGRIYGISAV